MNCEFAIVERWKRFCHNEIYNFIFSSLCHAAGEISATTNAKRERVNKWYIYCWFVWNEFEKRIFIARPLEMMVLFALLHDALCKRIDINSRRCGISAEKSIKNLLNRREMNVRVASNGNPIFFGGAFSTWIPTPAVRRKFEIWGMIHGISCTNVLFEFELALTIDWGGRDLGFRAQAN